MGKLPAELAGKIVVFDLEVHPESGNLLQIGALRPDREVFLRTTRDGDPHRSLADLADYAGDATFVVGHNILFHDLPWLRGHDPGHPINRLLPVDTLLLAPLAYPRNPYHHLCKGYKPIDSSRNNPVRDSRACFELLLDELKTLSGSPLRHLFQALLLRCERGRGTGEFLRRTLACEDLDGAALWRDLRERFSDRSCNTALERLPQCNLGENGTGIALAVSWLSVCGEKSRLAPWVVHTFPETVAWLREAREKPCGACPFCETEHSTDDALQRYFGHAGFRPIIEQPPTSQKDVVEAILRGEDLLLVLATGGGKSLCYQLPALMLAKRRNLLTLVISPLQSLMKDQVDILRANNLTNVGTINGLLTMFERLETLEGIQSGEIDILFVAPEQMRNESFCRKLRQREIGLVVVDEAHCFSKWGHDFRPDYLFICKFLRQVVGEDLALPPVACFTATAKPEVIEEIRGYFQREAGKSLRLIQSGIERPNLRFFVHGVKSRDKRETIVRLLRAGILESGGAIVFTGTQKRAQELSEYLRDQEFRADFFHAGRKSEDKMQVQDDFKSGRTQVICATNAFGMGVDKADVRMVIHLDIPGSLENYLQEAGRAGRDKRPAECHLLFDDDDLEFQFQLTSGSKIGAADLIGIFRGVRKLAGKKKFGKDDEVIKTTGEILREEETATDSFDAADANADTKVKIAIAWLENLGKLERTWNKTTVIEAKPLFANLEAAEKHFRELDLPPHVLAEWKRLYFLLLGSSDGRSVSTDDLSANLGRDSQEIIETLRKMRDAGLISHDVQLSAWLDFDPKTDSDSKKRWERFIILETKLLGLFRETEFAVGEWVPFSLRLAATRISDRPVPPREISRILDALQRDDGLKIEPQGFEHLRLKFRKPVPEILRNSARRRRLAGDFLGFLRGKTLGKSGRHRIEFTMRELETICRRHLFPEEEKETLLPLIRRGMLNLDDCGAIELQNGMAVFRPALTLRLISGEVPVKDDCRGLEEYFDEKNLQVHVIGKYAGDGKADIRSAWQLVRDYFSCTRDEFVEKHFHGEKQALERPVSPEQFDRIVGRKGSESRFSLSEIQRKIVTAGVNRNILVLAGPGSGKTKVLVHRAAYLTQVKRAQAGSILVVAFNRSTVHEIRERLKAFLGRNAWRVRVLTYHGLALRVANRSLAVRDRGRTDAAVESPEDLFRVILKDAVEILRSMGSAERSEATDGIVGRLRYLLVDEYQDINQDEYDLISLLAQKDIGKDERKVHLLAVGDDDQNIYSFQGSSTRFIRKFRDDYETEDFSLVENYRSTPAITELSQQFIARNSDRLKTGGRLRSASEGNLLCENVPPRLVRAPSAETADAAMLAEINALVARGVPLERIAILTYRNSDLYRFESLAKDRGWPAKILQKVPFPLVRTREFQEFLDWLKGVPEKLSPGDFKASVAVHLGETPANLVDNNGPQPKTAWREQLEFLIGEFWEESSQPAPYALREFIFDASREIRQGEGERQPRITLATMHASKGLEFDAVIVRLEGLQYSTSCSDQADRLADLRRLLYVAMTRARTHLIFISSDLRMKPVEELFSIGVPNAYDGPGAVARGGRRVIELGLRDLYLSFAGHSENHETIASAMRRLHPGMPVEIVRDGDHRNIVFDGVIVCRLSQAGNERNGTASWPARLPGACTAVLRWFRDDQDPRYVKGTRRESWEVPVVEVEVTGVGKR